MYRHRYQNIDYYSLLSDCEYKNQEKKLPSCLFSFPHLDGGFQFIPLVLTFLNCSIHIPSLLSDMHLTRGKKQLPALQILFFSFIFFY